MGFDQHPTEKKLSGPIGGTRYDHPAFGIIGLSRVSSTGHRLFGSDFNHHSYVTLRISQGHMVRSDLHYNRHHADASVIEVAMTESQFASMIASFGVGDGVPCTIEQIENRPIPGIKSPEPRNRPTAQFAREVATEMEAVQRKLSLLEAKIKDFGLSARKEKELTNQIDGIRQDIGTNLNFVANQFCEFMEETVDRARGEIASFAQNCLPQNQPPPITQE